LKLPLLIFLLLVAWLDAASPASTLSEYPVKVLHIHSLKQTLKNGSIIIFDKDVEVLIDTRVHLWADKVTFNKKTQDLTAESFDGSAVVVEDNNFFILADRITFNLNKKVGRADNIRFHVEDGYFSAGKAEKINDDMWRMENMMYTACDQAEPHWRITAQRATVYASYYVKAAGLVFKVGHIPVFALPRFVFPIQARSKTGQERSKSGFLLPRFWWDYQYGVGFKYEYYKYIHPHCDTTLGIDWRNKKGVMFFNEFRWARSLQSHTYLNSSYAIERDRFVQRRDDVVKGTLYRYWIYGKNFQTFSNFLNQGDLYTLMRVDIGTDKGLGYYFFNTTDEVDDTFYNSVIARLFKPKSMVMVQLDSSRTSRAEFVKFNGSEQKQFDSQGSFATKELDDRVQVIQLPHAAWTTTFKNFQNFLYYRHHTFFDQILYRQNRVESFFVDSHLVGQTSIIPLRTADAIRFYYKGNLSETFGWKYSMLTLNVDPTFQIVSQRAKDFTTTHNVLEQRVLNKGASRLFFEYGAEWALPEGTFYSRNGKYAHTLQPLITWNWVPKFIQDNWFYFDKYDRAYPKHEVAVMLRNNWDINDWHLDFDVKQGYDFYSRNDIFYLRRGVKQCHLLPFSYDFGVVNGQTYLGLRQEYEWGNFDLLQSEINLTTNINRFHLGIGYVYQNRGLQQQRQLLSNIPHFIVANIAIPLSKHATLGYDGQFNASSKGSPFLYEGLSPLVHRIRFDYDGHCWGFYVGLEEKKFKEYGMGRTERALVFSFRLNSLGSFAKKFKQVPQIVKNSYTT